jgi:hypothetical protein
MITALRRAFLLLLEVTGLARDGPDSDASTAWPCMLLPNLHSPALLIYAMQTKAAIYGFPSAGCNNDAAGLCFFTTFQYNTFTGRICSRRVLSS